jgi:hypothetical protein
MLAQLGVAKAGAGELLAMFEQLRASKGERRITPAAFDAFVTTVSRPCAAAAARAVLVLCRELARVSGGGCHKPTCLV